MNPLVLSHSQIEMFRSCSEKWRLHYQERLREDALHSPLFFGVALDQGISCFLRGGNAYNSNADNPYKTFEMAMKTMELNGKTVSIPLFEKVHYNKGDFEPRLLTLEDYQDLNEKFDSIVTITSENIEYVIEEIRQLKKDPSWKLPIDELRLFNYVHWLSLLRKGDLMLTAYEKQILPHITKVHAIQKKVSLKNNEDDELIGYIDFIADYDGIGPIIFDNKTSSRKYKEDSVTQSQQLVLYSENEGINKAGFIVLVKEIKWVENKTCIECKHEFISKHKTCPKCDGQYTSVDVPNIITQVLIDDHLDSSQTKVFEDIQIVADGIKNEEFVKNFESCYSFGRPCQYYNVCRGGDMHGLVKLEKK